MGVVVYGREEAKAVFRGMRKRMKYPEPMWPKVKDIVSDTARRQFSSSGAYLDTPWRPLKPEYKVWKAANGYPRSILIMTGELRDSFIGSSMDISEMGGKRARFGSSNPKAAWHHFGTRRDGRQVNPPRPILWAHDVVAKEVVDLVADFIIDRKRGRLG